MLGLVKYALLGCLIALTGAGVVLFIITDFSGFVGFLKICVAYMAVYCVAGVILGIKQGLNDIKKAKNLSL
jgi:hypothetical protein